MNRLVVLLLLLLGTVAESNGSYSEYYIRINKAELCITENNFQVADAIYNDLRHEYGKLFSNDLWNAALCSALLGKEERAKEYIEEGISLGYYKLHDFMADSLLKQFVQGIDSNAFPIDRTPLNSSYLILFEKLFLNEQSAGKLSVQKYYQAIANTTKELYNLFVNDQESVVHFFQYFDSIKRKALIIHYYGLSGNDDNVDDELDLSSYNLDAIYRKAVDNGLLHVSEYAFAYDYSLKKEYKLNPELTMWILRDSSQVFLAVPSKRIVCAADSIRGKVGLPKFDDMMTKIRYKYPYLQNYPMHEFTQFIETLEKDPGYLYASNYISYYFKKFEEFSRMVMDKLKCRYNFKFATLNIMQSYSNPYHPSMGDTDDIIPYLFYRGVIESNDYEIYKWR